MKQINTRQSNFELLRIVCILGIILHHLIIKGASTCGYVTPYNFNKDGIFGVILNSFIVGGGKLLCSNYRLVRCIQSI